jgi:hypothetical protein
MKRLAVQLNRSSLFKLSPHKRHTVFILSLILGSNTTAVALTKLLSGMPFDVKESAEIHCRFDSMSVGRGVHDCDIIESGESVSDVDTQVCPRNENEMYLPYPWTMASPPRQGP